MLLGFFSCLSYAAQQFAADFIFRMHNAKGWTGTSTKFDGYSGYCVELPKDVVFETFFAEKRERPEVIVMPLEVMTDANLKKIEKLYHPKSYLQAVVVLNSNDAPHCYDVPFPNKEYSWYDAGDFKWNEECDSLITQTYSFPVIFPPEEEAKNLKAHMEKFGGKAGLYLRVFMQSRGNDELCLKDEVCMPVGGLSIFGNFQGTWKENTVWAISSMDTYGAFPYGSVGTDKSIAGFVATIAALEALRDADWEHATRPLAFGFFDAEDNGYIGSEKFIHDITNFKCEAWDDDKKYCLQPYRLLWEFQNVKMDQITTIVEMKHIANAEKLYAHITNTDAEKDFRTTVKRHAGSRGLSVEDAGEDLPGIPPSSTHSFLKQKNDIQHVVLTGFQNKYPSNNRYGSPSDSAYSVDSITKAAQTYADILAGLCGVTAGEVNTTIVDGLMQGFVNAPDQSTYMKSLFPSNTLPSDHVSLYSGVYSMYKYNLKQLVIRNALKDAVSYNVTDVKCQADADCSGLNSESSSFLCSTKNFCEAVVLEGHPAYSNAYEYNYEEGKFFMTNIKGNWPRAAEANWMSPDFQYVTFPTMLTGRIATYSGIFLWIVTSVVLGFFWSKNSAKLKTN